MTAGDDARAPAKVGSRDGKVARDPDLCIGMSARIMRNALMVEELSNSTLDERLHALQWPRQREKWSFRQAVVVKMRDDDT